ncbi:ComEC/Rec2 family competence protein [Mailhella sp.]
MARSSLPSLLFRQMLILALIAGACTVRSPAVGIGLLAMLVLVPERGSRASFFRRLLKLMAMFLLGFALVHQCQPDVPDKPSWAAVPRQALLVEGEVESVTGLPGGRVRLLLGRVRQAEIPHDLDLEHAGKLGKALRPPRSASSESGVKSYAGGMFFDNAADLPGLVALTLDARQTARHGRPFAGQNIQAVVRLFPSGGSRNAMENGAGAYWAAREVWHHARLVRQKGEALHLRFSKGDGLIYSLCEKREGWRSNMQSLLSEAKDDSRPSTFVSPVSREQSKEAASWTQGKAMLVALLFGDRSGLSLHTVDLFTRAGLVHSLALSGQHLALAAMFGLLSVALLSLARPELFQLRPKRMLIAWAGLPFAFIYLFLGGAPFSLVRAAFMMLAGAVFLSLRRPSAPLDALFAAVLLLFVVWPLAVFDLSVQLSVCAVTGIMLSLPLISFVNSRIPVRFDEPWYHRWLKKTLRWLAALLIVSVAAQTAVLPLLTSVFGAVSPCFWLNVFWLPLLTFITLPLSALGLALLMMFGSQAVSALLFEAAAWPADLILFVLECLDAEGWLPFIQCFRPAPLSSLGYGAVLAALALLAQCRLCRHAVSASVKRLLCFGVFFLLAGQVPQWMDDVQAHVEKRVTLSLIDVGAGQAALIEYPGGRVLIDGGGNNSPFFDSGKSIVAPLLTERRLPRLDAVIVSHCDVDHARGLRWILDHFSVKALCWSPVSAHRADSGEGKALRGLACRHKIPERILRQGETLELGNGLRVEVLAPNVASDAVPSEKELSSNDGSLALRLSYEGQGLALLCGDMLSSALGRLAGSGQDLRAEVLVLPHHGAASSFQKKFYDMVSPRAALASTAPFSHFGFPSRKVRAEMDERGIPLLSTSELGTVRVRWRLEDGRYRLKHPLGHP